MRADVACSASVSGVPYSVNCCSPYHFCFCIKCCGDVVAVAPHSACTNCCCAGLFPCCFTWCAAAHDARAARNAETSADPPPRLAYVRRYPGLADSKSFVDYLTVVRADYLARKSASAARAERHRCPAACLVRALTHVPRFPADLGAAHGIAGILGGGAGVM